MITPRPYGDAIAAVLSYLRVHLPAIRFVGNELPNNYLASQGVCVVVSRIGGTGDRYSHDAARVDIEVYGPTTEQAQDALQWVLSYLRVAHTDTATHAAQKFMLCDIELGPSDRPDSLTNEPKWEATVIVRLRPVRSAP